MGLTLKNETRPYSTFISLWLLFKRQGIFSQKIKYANPCQSKNYHSSTISRMYWNAEWTLFSISLTSHTCTYKTLRLHNFLLPKKAKILICLFLLNTDKCCFLLFSKEQVDFGYFQSKALCREKYNLEKDTTTPKKVSLKWFQ